MLLSLVFALSTTAQASIWNPLNLNFEYQLIFVTTATTQAIGEDINDYDNFVTSTANAEFTGQYGYAGTRWSAVGSTSAVDARDHALIVQSVWNTAGEKVADNYSDMWDGSLDNPINYFESGSRADTIVWTGSATNGTGSSFNHELGDDASSRATRGSTLSNNGSWISQQTSDTTNHFRMYALSETLNSTSPVPLPGAIWLFSFALIGFFGSSRRKL